MKATRNSPALPELLLVSAGAVLVFHSLFFRFAPVFWGAPLPLNPAELTPWIHSYMWERDGTEGYALYAAQFGIVLTALGAWRLYLRFARGRFRLFLAALLLLPALQLLNTLGFQPPMGALPPFKEALGPVAGLAAALAALAAAGRYLPRAAPWLAALLCLPPYFIASRAVYWFDSSYVLTPALQLVQGADFRGIFYQYDIFLSLVAAAWLKLGLDPVYFQVLGQASLWAVAAGVFLFARSFFRNKSLAAPLLVVLVAARVYASPWDATCLPQGTGLRLDLWLAALLLVWRFGPLHWGVGLFLGLMLLLHRAFGIIYTAAYIQLLLALLAADALTALRRGGWRAAGCCALERLKAALPCLGLLAAGLSLHLLLFGWSGSTDPIMIYQRLGLGFLRIIPQSFWWYMAVIFGAAGALLFERRSRLPEDYFNTGLFALLLAMGSSLYFFGRSHENNLLAICAPLLLCLFLFLDLALDREKETAGVYGGITRGSLRLAPYALVLLAGAYYALPMKARAGLQYDNFRAGRLVYQPEPVDLAEVKLITRNSPRVYFLTAPVFSDTERDFMKGDFLYYYRGGYRPRGFWSPFQTWLKTADLSAYLQNLLDDGYYLVANAEYYAAVGLPPGIKFSNSVITTKGYLIAWK
jgi:hypothetical protein